MPSPTIWSPGACSWGRARAAPRTASSFRLRRPSRGRRHLSRLCALMLLLPLSVASFWPRRACERPLERTSAPCLLCCLCRCWHSSGSCCCCCLNFCLTPTRPSSCFWHPKPPSSSCIFDKRHKHFLNTHKKRQIELMVWFCLIRVWS